LSKLKSGISGFSGKVGFSGSVGLSSPPPPPPPPPPLPPLDHFNSLNALLANAFLAGIDSAPACALGLSYPHVKASVKSLTDKFFEFVLNCLKVKPLKLLDFGIHWILLSTS